MPWFKRKQAKVTPTHAAPAQDSEKAAQYLEEMAAGKIEVQTAKTQELPAAEKLPAPPVELKHTLAVPTREAAPGEEPGRTNAWFTPSESRLVRAMVIAITNPDDPPTIQMAAEILKPSGEPPTITRNIAEAYVSAREAYKRVQKEKPADIANNPFMKARHNLDLEVSKDKTLYSETPNDQARTLHDRYFRRGDVNTAMNTLLDDRAKKAMQRALRS